MKRSYELAVAIEAPIEAIWGAVYDVAGYGGWNPVIRRVKGALRPNAALRCTLSLHGRGVQRFTWRFERAQPPLRMTWRRTFFARRLLTIEHHFEVLPFKPGLSVFQQRWTSSGLFAGLTWSSLVRKLSAYEAMNIALRDRLESGRP